MSGVTTPTVEMVLFGFFLRLGLVAEEPGGKGLGVGAWGNGWGRDPRDDFDKRREKESQKKNR